MPSKRCLKDHVETTESFQILYTKFHNTFKDTKQKFARKFVSTLVLALTLENFICS